MTAPLRAFHGPVVITTLFCGAVTGALQGCSSFGNAAPAQADAGVVDADESDASTRLPADARPDPSVDGGSRDADVDGSVQDATTVGDTGVEAAVPPTYDNPVLGQDFPDPFVLREGATYYAFGTNSGSKNIQAAKSTDLAHWTVLPDALPTLPSWAASNAGLTWAPSVLQRGSTYVLYYVARYVAAGFQCISHAEAQKPEGPYVDSTGAPFVCQVSGAQSLCGSIDPSPFVDSDGTAYLVWKSDENAPACGHAPRLWSAPLAADGLSLAGSASQLLVMDQAWQQPVIEGPSMTVQAGKYYLLYSANAYESAAYAMGYATCLSAMGPCVDVSVSGPFISSAGTALGPGGGEFFEDAVGDRWLVYHAWTAPNTTYAGGGARSMRIDPVAIDAGALSFSGPTTTPQPF